jgi:hypothetical protein
VQLLGVPFTVCSTRSETSRPVEHCEAAIAQRRIQETSRTVEAGGVPGCSHSSHFPLTTVRPAEYLLINQSIVPGRSSLFSCSLIPIILHSRESHTHSAHRPCNTVAARQAGARTGKPWSFLLL